MPKKKMIPGSRGVPKKNSSWGEVAEWYDDLLEKDSNTYQSKVILPNLMRVLAPKPGDRIIDVACGQGFFTRACALAGASMTGADISPELIELARKQSPRTIPFHVAPAHELKFAAASTFDTAFITLAVQNIRDLDSSFGEIHRVLEPNGRLVLVINHPTFRVLKHSSWEYDEKTHTQYRRVDRYLSGGKILVDMHPGEKNGARTISYNRSLQDISKSLRKNGFAIVGIEEGISHRASGKGPRQKAEDTARKEIPLFMMLETVKLDASQT
jgi:ubiquinone/menaquinone biosynthesis C-methylase UbiE